MNTILLERFAYAPDGTFGKLTVDDLELYTVECPWLGNAEGESCIPEGVYSLGKRYSPIVRRTTNGAFSEGWEVLDVPGGRDLIMIHPANFPFELRGCIAPGLKYEIIPDRQGVYRQAVTSSLKATTTFMNILERSDYWDLEIIPRLIQYP